MSDPLLSPACLLDILGGGAIGVEYQPIVALATGETVGHEALARFRGRDGRPLPPDAVFRAFHASPLSLFQLELEAKRRQLAHAPAGGILFLNIDQDAFAVFGDRPDNPLLLLLADRPGVVVEIIENCSVADARISLTMLQAFRSRHVRLALDDIGAAETLVAMEVLAKVDIVKLSRDCLRRRDDPEFGALLAALRDFVVATGKVLVAEGIETEEERDWARAFGADYGQGFLYRSRFHRVAAEAVALLPA